MSLHLPQKLAPLRWRKLIPLAFITYSLAYLDRANYGFGAASGLAQDLNITPGISSLLGALFFLGYFFFQVPGGIYAEKRSAKKLIFWSLILWGILATATGMVHSVAALAVIRFLLGVAESVVMPAMLVFLSHWFTKQERSKANTFLFLGNPITVLWMSILSGYLVDALGWRGMFIIEGVPAIIWAAIWWVIFVDRPEEAKWLSVQEKADLAAALAAEQAEMKPVKNYGEALRSRKVLSLSFIHFFWNIGMYGFIMWLPSILKTASGLGIVATGWLSAAPYLLAVPLMLGASWFSDKYQQRKLIVLLFLGLGAVCFCASFTVGANHFWVSYVLLVIAGGAMYTPYGPFFAAIPELLPRNVMAGAMAFIVSFGALGSFVGSWIVGYLNGVFNGPQASYVFMGSSLVIAVLLTAVTRFTNKPVEVAAPKIAALS
ncbi:MFS transporter [Hafnia psychrotolerans]|jgi:sugar phosphate permease|uniref:2-ketogluconate transporter n=1 Tax=Hafnia psychrotolerans TaxID=1477018 RepID=A0ABQ1FXM0_9GAMM|nr:MFS transporter [Hafnia psychrotolerans]GGA33388.1 2-ketogluconate transporter [Hafnia psychrotolerans]